MIGSVGKQPDSAPSQRQEPSELNSDGKPMLIGMYGWRLVEVYKHSHRSCAFLRDALGGVRG